MYALKKKLSRKECTIYALKNLSASYESGRKPLPKSNLFPMPHDEKVKTLFLMPVRRYQHRFIIGVRHEARFALVRFFNVLSLAIIDGDFISVFSI